MKLTEDSVRRKMSRGKIVSFDIFDTALRRKVVSPYHLFYVMESALGTKLSAAIPAFARSRIEAEAEAWRRASQSRPSRQITLADILDVLKERHGLTTDEVASLRDLELETEKHFTYADPLFLRLHDQAREMGIKVIFLSDMYLPGASLRIILEHHGFPDPVVFVSAEEGGNKANGRLYRLVAEKMGLPAVHFLHFGDNYYADYVRARLSGWRAVHVANSSDHKSSHDAGRWTGQMSVHRLSISVGRALVRRRKMEGQAMEMAATGPRFWDDFGYGVAGPIYFHFLRWLCLQAAQDKIGRLLLCSRDGFPLLRGFEILREKWGLQIETRYFYASRRLFNLAAIHEINPANLDFLLMPSPGFRLRDFVARLGLDPEAHAPALLRLGFTSLDQQLVHSGFGRFIDPAHRQRLESWVKICEEELLTQAQKERLLVLEYLAEMQPGRPDTAVVDLGWKATVCASMCHLLRKADSVVQPRTYFFGTYEQARHLLDAGGRPNSFLFHLGEPVRRKKLVAGHEGVVEMLFCAPHGSLRGLQRGPHGLEPVYGMCEYDEPLLRDLEAMRTGAYCFIEDMAELLPPSLDVAPAADEVETIMARLTRHPTRTEARLLGTIPYRVSYGSHGMIHPLAKVSTHTPYRLQDDLLAYEQAPWKEGYLAQVSFPRRVILPAIHFLRSIYVALTSKTLFVSLRWLLFKR